MTSPAIGPDIVAGPVSASGDGARDSGLTTGAAAERLRQDGPNVIGGSGRRTRFAILLAQMASPLVLILVAASLVSHVVGDRVTAGIILTIVVMSATLGFVQEARSESAVAALQARLTLRATVVRDGQPQAVPIHDVVRGDLVTLSAGDIVPADVDIIEADHLYIDEASLTGESAPSAKAPRPADAQRPDADDHDGRAFFGTSVVSGTGSAVVTATGARLRLPSRCTPCLATDGSPRASRPIIGSLALLELLRHLTGATDQARRGFRRRRRDRIYLDADSSCRIPTEPRSALAGGGHRSTWLAHRTRQ